MILITRPRTEANILSEKLLRSKVHSFVEPMTSFRYYNKNIKYDKEKVYLIASLQSVRALLKNKSNNKKLIKFGKFFVIGKKVGESLKVLGCKNIIRIFQDSNELIKYLSKIKNKDLELEYLCGSVVNQDFVSELNLNNFLYKKNIIYQSIPRKNLSERCLKLIKGSQIKVILIYSVLGAETFIQLLKQKRLLNKISKVKILCLSKRISSKVSSLSNHRIVISAPSPNESSIIKYLIK
tara:strand:+ start:155 stop:868 length:714 start_codon:yes stop_codon:yes gene_type:complete